MKITNSYKFKLIFAVIGLGGVFIYFLSFPNILFDFEEATTDERIEYLTEMGNTFIDGVKSRPGGHRFSLTSVDPEKRTVHIDQNFDEFNNRDKVFSPKNKATIRKSHRRVCSQMSYRNLYYIKNMRLVITWSWRGEVIGVTPVSRDDCAQFKN